MNAMNYIKLEFPSKSCNEAFARTAAAAFAAQLDPTLDELGDIKTAVSEAVTNSIVHAYPDAIGKVSMRMRILDGNVLEISIRDWGRGIENLEQAMKPLFTTGGEERSGMGFTIGQLHGQAPRPFKPRKGDNRDDAARRPPENRPPMSEDIYSLLRMAQGGDKEAAGRLVEENSGLIWSIARRFFGRGVDPDDLYQLGCVGFLKAIDGFDEGYGTRFSTYAVPKISGEIRRFLRDDGMVKVSRGVKEQAQQIRAARMALEQRIGREPTISELARETGMSAEDIAFAETATGPAESLQRETGEDGFTLELVLGDYGAEEKLVEHVALRAAIEKLPERERQVVALRYYHGMTQQNCAKVLHVSQVQISRLERRAVDELRKMLS